MDDLKRLEGKTIKTAKENNNGENSYFIINFKDSGKLTVVAYRHGDEGVANLDINLNGLKADDLVGKKVLHIEEEFDGEVEHLTLKFKDNSSISISPFASGENQTAGLQYTVYAGDKIVAESLEELFENKYKDGRSGNYIMNSPQYENEEEDPEEDE